MRWLGEVAAREESLRHIAEKKQRADKLSMEASRDEPGVEALRRWAAVPGADRARREEQPGYRLQRVLRQGAHVPADMCEAAPERHGFGLESHIGPYDSVKSSATSRV